MFHLTFMIDPQIQTHNKHFYTDLGTQLRPLLLLLSILKGLPEEHNRRGGTGGGMDGLGGPHPSQARVRGWDEMVLHTTSMANHPP